jgi:hypothetical protein
LVIYLYNIKLIINYIKFVYYLLSLLVLIRIKDINFGILQHL